MLHISLSADKIIQIGHNFYLTNTVLATWVTMITLIFFAGLATFFLKKEKNNYLVLGSKIFVNFFYNFINGVTENPKLTWLILPLIATLFVYITTANWLGLVPGFIGVFVIQTKEGAIPIFKSINADLNTTFSMAITSIILLKITSSKFPESKDYLSNGINKFVHFIIIFFEDLSEMTRIISLSFRLTGNIFAGEVLLLVLAFISPYFIPVPFMFLEFFIGLFQALVFSVLILIFVKW
ncbi:MAG: F0F1 ATP synthase subunit A [Xanthomonadaceae bacterium]|nr:F0F1 ATP synthase subunit A [Rhodospirillaceae bacterium]NIA17899.1 F0F1 ATP synthase subunit A [Xanthomonadaceae bacterium]